MKICPNCGKKISDDSVFCTYCGKMVENTIASQAMPETVAEKPRSYAAQIQEKHMIKAEIPESYTMRGTLKKGEAVKYAANWVGVFFELMAAVYVVLEVWQLLSGGMKTPYEIISYLFLNALIPLGLLAAGKIICLLGDIRAYAEAAWEADKNISLHGNIKVDK